MGDAKPFLGDSWKEIIEESDDDRVRGYRKLMDSPKFFWGGAHGAGD